jgi:hypothetical protein
MVTGKRYNAELLGRSLCLFVDKRWQQLINTNEWQTMLKEYNQLLYGRGVTQRLRTGNSTAAYKIVRVNDMGELIAGENQEYHFKHGEVEWILPVV